jgi:hypothetical protein
MVTKQKKQFIALDSNFISYKNAQTYQKRENQPANASAGK